jgi:hypothetical protein
MKTRGPVGLFVAAVECVKRTRAWVVPLMWISVTGGAALADTSVSNWDLQAVNAQGAASNPLVGSETKVIIEGICLNNPEDMLNPINQWQVFVQGEGADKGGTAAWTGSFFQSSIWSSELARLNASGFRAGDRIRITGYANDSTGKSNINERHTADPDYNFTVELVQAGVGLPEPKVTTVSAMNTFDSSRVSGGESYQCRRIELDHVTLTSGTSAWASNTVYSISDATSGSQTLPLRLCNVNFGTQKPATWFNIVGLGDQESSYSAGYQVWVTDVTGIQVPGDCNLDGSINASDLAIMASHWDYTTTGGWAAGDFTGDGLVNGDDLSLSASNWGYGPASSSATFAQALALTTISVPEPTAMALLGIGAMALLRRRKTHKA